MRKKFGFVIALALFGALSVAGAPKAHAATINISAPADWGTKVVGGMLTLNHGDTLNISPSAGSPGSSVQIWISPNANVWIYGNGGSYSNLWISESSADTDRHDVTINNLRITGDPGHYTYRTYKGLLVLEGANAFANNNSTVLNANSAAGNAASVYSETGGALSLTSYASVAQPTLTADVVNILGNAAMTVNAGANGYAVYVRDRLTVDLDARLTINATSSTSIRGEAVTVRNWGRLTVNSSAPVMPLYGTSVTIEMAPGAVTSIMTQSSKAYKFVTNQLGATGHQWRISGSASFMDDANALSNPTAIVFPASTAAGVVELIPIPPPPANPVLPMLRFTESPDMTGDGLGDTLAVDSWGYLWVFPGTSTGLFGSPVSRLGSGFASLKIAAPGDVNSDGRADVLAIDSSGNLLLYAGNLAKALSAPKQVGNGWTGWKLIPAGDLTGDAKVDLLSIDSLGDLYMYPGKGDGTFGTKKKVGNGWNGWQLFSAGDLNGDGKTDILGINDAGDLYQYAGRGDGTFSTKVLAGNGWTGYTLAAGGDLNGDGKADILGLNQTTRVLYVYLGQGNAKFATKKQVATGW